MQKTSFLEPLQGIWTYACRPDGAGGERRKKGLQTVKEFEKEQFNSEEGKRWKTEEEVKRKGIS